MTTDHRPLTTPWPSPAAADHAIAGVVGPQRRDSLSAIKGTVKRILPFLLALATAGAAALAQDSTSPRIEGVGSLDGVTVGVSFDEALDPLTANDSTRYTLNSGTVTAAVLQADGKTVALTVDGLPAQFTVTVAGVADLSGNADTSSSSGQILTAFVAQDLGFVDAPGLALSSGSHSFDVWARGLDIWGFADSGHFLSEDRAGDFDIKVQVAALTAPGNDASAGLMVREDSGPGSRNVSVVVYPRQKNWTAAQRVETDGASSVFPGDWRINWPAGVDYPDAWLRIKRAGNTFTTYGSTNGLDWVQIGESVTPDTPYPDRVMVGLRTVPTEVTAPNTIAHASYRNYGPFTVTGATLTITQHPTHTTVVENTTAQFSVEVEVTGTSSSNLGYQWQRNGADIPNATTRIYQTERLGREDNNARFRVIVSLPGGQQVTSEEATLTVENDTTPPQILSISSLGGTSIGISLSELLSESTAADPGRYTLTGGTVSSATLQPDGMTVVLAVSGITGTSFSLTLNGITDLAGNGLSFTTGGTVLNLTPQDIGEVDAPGVAWSPAPGAVDVIARGLDIWGTADSGHFVWELLEGDFDVRVQVQSFTAPAPDANAGLMARESLEAGSRNVGIVVYANQKNWTAAQRVETGGASSVLGGDWRIQWPEAAGYSNIWVRLKRSGNTFSTYGGTNGVIWTQIGNSVTPPAPYPDALYVGLRTTPVEVEIAGSSAVVQYRHYGPFVVSGAGINILQQPTNAVVVEYTRATFTVLAEVTGTEANLEYQWQKNGEDIAGANAATHVTEPLARTDDGAKYRVKLSLPGIEPVFSQDVSVTVNPDLIPPKIVSTAALGGGGIGILFDEALDPATAGDPSRYTLGGSATVVTAQLLPDGLTVALQLEVPPVADFTLAVNGVTDRAGNSLAGSASGTLLALTSTDLGVVEAPAVAVSAAGGAVDVIARGLDIWGFADSGHFVHESLTGDFDVKVQVIRFEAPAPDANAGLMARETLEPGSRNFQIVVYANQSNWTATQRAQTDGNSSVLAGNWRINWPQDAFYPNVWVRLKRSGQTFTTYGSNDGLIWTPIGDSTTPDPAYPETIYVGMRTTPVEVEMPGSSGFAQYRNYGPFIETTVPELTVLWTGPAELTLSWPQAGSEGFLLQSSRSLTGGPWTPVDATPTTEEGVHRIVLPAATDLQFFRLLQ